MALPAVRSEASQHDDPTGDGDVMDLHRRYRRTRDPGLREALVGRHADLVRRLAARFAHRGEELDDLVQVAFWGLLKALDRFDPDHGVRFATFATPTIMGELKRHFRDRRWNIRVRGRSRRITSGSGRRASCCSRTSAGLRRSMTSPAVRG